MGREGLLSRGWPEGRKLSEIRGKKGNQASSKLRKDLQELHGGHQVQSPLSRGDCRCPEEHPGAAL